MRLTPRESPVESAQLAHNGPHREDRVDAQVRPRCRVRPDLTVSISKPTNPLCATATSRSVGSVTIAAIGPQALVEKRTRAEAAGLLVAHRGNDQIAGQATNSMPPRSWPRQPRLHVVGTACHRAGPPRRPARADRSISPAPTVSVWASRSSVRPPPSPRAVAITFGRPGATSETATSRPAFRSQSATSRPISSSPPPPLHERGVDRVDRNQALQQLGQIGHFPHSAVDVRRHQ